MFGLAFVSASELASLLVFGLVSELEFPLVSPSVSRLVSE